MTKWLRDSGLKVNESKTELCLFHRFDHVQISINLNGSQIKSQINMNVLGVMFDSKLQWGKHVSNINKKAMSALHAIRLIRPYFNQTELRQLVTANFYSILYYNSEVWHLPKLNQTLKRNLFTASANALKVCTPFYDNSISYDLLHTINERATPEMFMQYKHAIQLYKIFNLKEPPLDWISLNFDQFVSRRQTKFKILQNQKYKIGNNILSNRLCVINGRIGLDWLNLSLPSFKIKCKRLFLQ